MATRLYLIRHGETDWNLKGKYCGHHDIKLNRKGLKQAMRLCKKLKTETIHKVFSSDSLRAFVTAEIALKGRAINKRKQLREMHFGCFEGLTHQEIKKRYGSIYKKWLADPGCICIPKGESLAKFKKRVTSAIKKIISLNRNKNIAIFCHSGTISIFFSEMLKRGNFWKNIPSSASISMVEFKRNKPKIKSFNDTRHLNG